MSGVLPYRGQVDLEAQEGRMTHYGVFLRVDWYGSRGWQAVMGYHRTGWFH